MNLYIRFIWHMIAMKFASALKFTDEDVLELRVLPLDLDFNGHMNNGRFLSIMDFGRMGFAVRTGVYETVKKNRWFPIAAAISIRYRRPLNPFCRYQLRTRIMGWDDTWFYFEQRFVNAQGQVAALALAKTCFVSKSGRVPTHELVEKSGYKDIVSPALPDYIEQWNAADEQAWQSGKDI